MQAPFLDNHLYIMHGGGSACSLACELQKVPEDVVLGFMIGVSTLQGSCSLGGAGSVGVRGMGLHTSAGIMTVNDPSRSSGNSSAGLLLATRVEHGTAGLHAKQES